MRVASTTIRTVGSLTVTLLTVSLLVGAAPADTPAGEVIAEGTFDLSDADAAPPTSATLFAWPANEVLADLEVGEQVHLEPVGAAEVAGDGSFTVTVDDAETLESYASGYGEVNLYLSADNGASEFASSFAVSVADVAQVSGDDASVVDLGTVSEVGHLVEDPAAAGEVELGDYVEKSCSTAKRTNLGNFWVPIGGLFSTNPGSSVDFQYSTGQSSTLGVAASTKGPTTGFSVSGTSSISSTSTVDYPTMSGKGSKLARTQVRYGKYAVTCQTVRQQPKPVSVTTYTVRPDLWVGGTSFAAVSTPSASYCTSYLKGSTFTKDKSKQVPWNGAVTVYGVGLSAQTGWSSKGKLVVKFPNAGGKVCGSGGYATESTAYQIVVK